MLGLKIRWLISLLNPYNPKNFGEDKLSILDIKALGEGGKRFNIEIQLSDEADYDQRALYYWAKLYTEQLKVSEGYTQLSKAIGIHILNFISIPNSEKYHNVFHIREKESGLLYFKDLELHTIELKKFCPTLRTELAELALAIRTSLDMWVAFLTRHHLLREAHLPAHLNNHPSLQKAIHVLDVMNFRSDEREVYEDRLKWFRMELSCVKKAEEKGHERGLQEGLERGLQEGLERGLRDGIQNERIEIARKLMESGMPTDQVMQITGLTEHAMNTVYTARG